MITTIRVAEVTCWSSRKVIGVTASPNLRFPINMSGRPKYDMRTQFGALCWRREAGKLRILLITSRDTGRWVTPKGWPMHGKTPAEAAAQEAWEEAGVSGIVGPEAVGVFSYIKPLDRTRMPCLAMIFPLEVREIHKKWPEDHERTRKWFSPKKAAKMVNEHELKQIILRFAEMQD